MIALEREYRGRFVFLESLAGEIEALLKDYLKSEERIDRISARAKSVDRFLEKASALQSGKAKYDDPMRQIQDQVGARIITFYRSDVDRIVERIKKYFRAIEAKDMVPDHQWKFGYFGRHFILIVPSETIDSSWDKSKVPQVFELQVRTLFQHAWSEANHDLGYKPTIAPLDGDAERKLAFAAAQAWGADEMFENLFQELSGQVGELSALIRGS